MITMTEHPEVALDEKPAASTRIAGGDLPAEATPIGLTPHRRPAVIAGRITAIGQRRWAGCLAFECRLDDDTGAVTLVFLGRRQIAGIDVGRRLIADGTVGDHRGRILMLNPLVTLLDGDPEAGACS